jgi:hypothetical protein
MSVSHTPTPPHTHTHTHTHTYTHARARTHTHFTAHCTLHTQHLAHSRTTSRAHCPQVDRLLETTRSRIGRRREILQDSSHTILPIGVTPRHTDRQQQQYMQQQHRPIPESQRQSTAIDSSFASEELRALLNRELMASPLSSTSSPLPSSARDGDEHWALFDYTAVRSVRRLSIPSSLVLSQVS